MLPFKISVLIFVRNEAGELLLIERKKEPTRGKPHGRVTQGSGVLPRGEAEL